MNLRYFWMLIAVLPGILVGSVMVNAGGDETKSKVTVGWLERVYLPDHDFTLRGKMDTGAKNSSLHATEMEFITVEGKSPQSRVRFATTDNKGGSRTIEADITREVRIKKSTLDSETPLVEGRVEIELLVCLAGITRPVRVNLTNREGMNYPLILGRTALDGVFVVDVSQTFINSNKCPAGSKSKKPGQETME